MSSSSSSSSRIPEEKYDVFLSFRGETREKFTSHLYSALVSKKIETFIDNEELPRGDEISSSLIEAIETSLIYLVILSKSYASSRWCLDELEQILECKKTYGRIVIPVFFDVNPTDVRKQTGSYGDAFAEHEKDGRRRPEKLQKWRDVLTEVANLSGWDSNVIPNESVLIENIVNNIIKRLNDICSSNEKDDDLVGLDPRIQKLEHLLCTESMGVRGVGIWGLGGIGKTTLARAVFNKIGNRFESSCFIENVRETEEKTGLNDLRGKLFSAILKDKDIDALIQGINFTKRRLRRMKVLIVLDDLTRVRQMKDLIGGMDWYGSGSRVIITSRDKKVLDDCKVDKDDIYEVEGLSDDDAMELFSRSAFRQNHPTTDHVELSDWVLSYMCGVPLALKIFGSFLHGKTEKGMESAVDRLKRTPNTDIMEVLKVSYDGLNDEEKCILLDIACLFDDRLFTLHEFKHILDASGFHTEIGLYVLADKCLINKDTLRMHDLVLQMAREIVRQESPKDPGRRSRLWNHEDIYQVLTKNTGTKEIEGMSLDISIMNEDMDIHPQAFAKMYNLRFFNFYNSKEAYYISLEENNSMRLSQGLDSNFPKLKYLRWDACPLKSWQSNLLTKNLVELRMRGSKLEELWHGVQDIPSLKRFDLSCSKYLVTMPDLSHAPNLERIELSQCESLISFPEIPPNLDFLNLLGCRKLATMPDLSRAPNLKEIYLSGCESLVEVHHSIQFLEKLTNPTFDDCKNLISFPEIPPNLKRLDLTGSTKLATMPDLSRAPNLWEIRLSGCESLVEVHHSIQFLEKLTYLTLDDCENLISFPEIPPNLRFLFFKGCRKPTTMPDLSRAPNLEEICLSGCESLVEVHHSIQFLEKLTRITLYDCENLISFPEIPPNVKGLLLNDCRMLKYLPNNISKCKYLEWLNISGCSKVERLPASIINLSALEFLDISNCNRLQFLPDLPHSLKTLYAKGCRSLEDISGILSVFRSLDANLEYRHKTIFTEDCFKLDANTLEDIILPDVLKILLKTAIAIEARFCYPGSRVPEWFMFQSKGSRARFELQPGWHNGNLIGIALSAVVYNQDSSEHILCCCTFGSFMYRHQFRYIYGELRNNRSDHVLVTYVFEFKDEASVVPIEFEDEANEVSVEFLSSFECTEVKMFGIHLLYANEFEEPQPNRLKSF